MRRNVEGVVEGVFEGVTEGVKVRMQSILMLLAVKEGIRIAQMAFDLNVPSKSLERYIRQLKDQGIIEFKGAPKTGGYYIKNKISKKIKK